MRADERAAKAKLKTISKFSWADEESKVKIYVDLNQFEGQVLENQIEVKFEDYLCEIKITDSNGV